jgi:hypothetical protein
MALLQKILKDGFPFLSAKLAGLVFEVLTGYFHDFRYGAVS